MRMKVGTLVVSQNLAVIRMRIHFAKPFALRTNHSGCFKQKNRDLISPTITFAINLDVLETTQESIAQKLPRIQSPLRLITQPGKGGKMCTIVFNDDNDDDPTQKTTTEKPNAQHK